MALTRLRTGGIAANAVVAASIAPGAVDITDIADGAVTENKLAANAVVAAKIANNAVIETKLAANAVTSAKIDSSVTLANVTITGGNVSANTIITGTLPKARLPAGSVLQLVSNVNTSTFSTSSQTFVTTNQSLSITPSSASNKILVIYNAGSVVTLAANTAIDIEVRRAANVICIGGYYTATVSGTQTIPFGVIQSLDSPNTTSSVTYEVFAKEGALAGTVTVNPNRVLTLMEIAG